MSEFDNPNEVRPSAQAPLSDCSLLEMTEALVAAHRAARRNRDPHALEMIEVALRYAGMRLADEFVSGQFHGGLSTGVIDLISPRHGERG